MKLIDIVRHTHFFSGQTRVRLVFFSILAIFRFTFLFLNLYSVIMMEDDDDDDDMVVQAAVANHTATLTVVCDAFIFEESQQQQAVAVLALCEHYGVASSPDLLSVEALLIFHDLLSLLGHTWRGSQRGKAPNVERGREAAMAQLVSDYFSGEDSTFSEIQFRRRFRMGRPLFTQIVDELSAHNNFFQQGVDALGKMGATPLQKATAACRPN